MTIREKRRHSHIKLIVLIGLLAIATLFSITQGSVRIPVPHVLKILCPWAAPEGIKGTHIFIVSQVRLPRILIAIFVGGILAVIGAVFQAIFRNPMADPYVMGVSSGAAFGATVGIVFGLGLSFMGLGMISGMAFAGALCTMLIVYTLARVGGKVSVTGILLAGIVMNALLSAMISLMMILFQTKIDQIVLWTMGSFNAASWDHVKLIALPGLLGTLYLVTLARELNGMLLGEDVAQNTGIHVERVKKLSLIIASLLAAFAVAVSGIIGFVGLIVPHICRLIFGTDHRVLLPASFLTGGLFLVLCDTAARSVVPNMEIPVGVITSIVGGPFFLVLLWRHKRRLT